MTAHQNPQRIVPEPAEPSPPTALRQPIGMWHIESAHPLRWAVIYGLTMVTSLLASHWAAGGFQ